MLRTAHRARRERGECLALSVPGIERLGAADPVLQVALMRNPLAAFHEAIGRIGREAGAFLAGR